MTSAYWSCGDGGPTEANTNLAVTRLYTNAGVCSVSLTVANANGSNTLTRSGLIGLAAVPAPGTLGTVGLNPRAGVNPFTITTTSGCKYRILYTADLLRTNAWTAVTPPLPDGWTNGINGPIILRDTNVAGATQRFYRAQATSLAGP